jgi:hypothetical protein
MNLAGELESTIADRFSELDIRRRSKLDRARECAILTVPSLMPPENWSEEFELPQPYSSVGSRGVTALASRMLSALIPLNDLPFFTFALKSGVEPEVEVGTLLDSLAMQVYDKMKSKNIREAFFQALQSLIVVGDIAVKIEEDFTFRCIRFDHYVAIRDVVGDLVEFIHLEFIPDETPLPADSQETWGYGLWNRNGFKTIFCRYVLDEEGKWHGRKEDFDGNVIDEGVYEVFPYAVLRWNSVVSENYGRSKCEEIFGDLKTLEAYTESLINGMAAASTFFMSVSPTGVTELTDLATAQNGEWVAARQEDVYVISPAQTINPQIQQTQNSVEMMRREIGEAFLMNRGSIRNAERVTATEVRMIGQELEQVLGGAFSSIARDLLVPVIKRTIYLMVEAGDIDPRLSQDFFDRDGRLTLDIVTGLQALSRDTELQKLMQMGEMIRNLPQQAVQHFRFDEYGKALISALGFDPRNWIKSQGDLDEERAKMMQEQTQAQVAGAAGQGLAQAAGQGVGQAAQAMAPQIMEQIMTGGGAPVQGGPMG